MTMPTVEDLRLKASAPNEPQQPEGFALVWADRAYEAVKPLDFLVHQLITVASVNLLVAPGGSGKTWIALWLAVCVSMGLDFLGFATKQAAVLIVDEESGLRRLMRRLFQVLNGALIKREDAPPIASMSGKQLDLGNPDHVNKLHVAILEANAKLVIIDALADVMPGRDENSVRDVMPVMLNLRSLAETTQAAFVILHHSNKANGNYRGSTAIHGAVDLLLQVEKAPESKYISFSTEKARDIEPMKFTAVASWIQEPPQFYLSATDVNPKAHVSNIQRFILHYLSEHPNTTRGDIESAAEGDDICTRQTARKNVDNLKDGRYIERTNSGVGRGVKAEYDLTNKGRDTLSRDE